MTAPLRDPGENLRLDPCRAKAQAGGGLQSSACLRLHARRLKPQRFSLRHSRERFDRQAHRRQPQNFPRHARIVPAQRVNRITNRRAGF